MTRAEHVNWCKERALEYLPDDPAQAVASMRSDMGKHAETDIPPALTLLAIVCLQNNDTAGLRRWIEGFN